MGISEKITRGFNRFGLQIKKHSPEILVITGIVGVVASAVLACKATTKAEKVVNKAKQDVAEIHEAAAHPETAPVKYTPETEKKDVAVVYARTGLELAKLYAPAVTVGTLSIVSILAGTNILHKRNVALAAAYTTVDNSFKKYRNNVIDRFGEELDKELRLGVKTEEVEETVVDEKGKEKKVKKTIKVANTQPEYSDYARCFEPGSEGWEDDAEHNLWYLKVQQSHANDLLRSQGHLFLNEVYDILGIPRSTAGAIVGWIYNEKNPNGDNYVDFGIYDINKKANRDFVNGYEKCIWLDFNVDGPIYDKI